MVKVTVPPVRVGEATTALALSASSMKTVSPSMRRAAADGGGEADCLAGGGRVRAVVGQGGRGRRQVDGLAYRGRLTAGEIGVACVNRKEIVRANAQGAGWDGDGGGAAAERAGCHGRVAVAGVFQCDGLAVGRTAADADVERDGLKGGCRIGGVRGDRGGCRADGHRLGDAGGLAAGVTGVAAEDREQVVRAGVQVGDAEGDGAARESRRRQPRRWRCRRPR